jgi:hypothetical protein
VKTDLIIVSTAVKKVPISKLSTVIIDVAQNILCIAPISAVRKELSEKGSVSIVKNALWRQFVAHLLCKVVKSGVYCERI